MVHVAKVRVARPTTDLVRIREFYEHRVGLSVIASFVDHDGFDGVIFGLGDNGTQLELVQTPNRTAPRPTPEDVLVLYCATTSDASSLVAQLRSTGVSEVADDDPTLNPYWPANGAVNFVDPDGYGLIVACD